MTPTSPGALAELREESKQLVLYLDQQARSEFDFVRERFQKAALHVIALWKVIDDLAALPAERADDEPPTCPICDMVGVTNYCPHCGWKQESPPAERAQAAEPVAWRYRYRLRADAKWSKWEFISAGDNEKLERMLRDVSTMPVLCEVQSLGITHPAPVTAADADSERDE